MFWKLLWTTKYRYTEIWTFWWYLLITAVMYIKSCRHECFISNLNNTNAEDVFKLQQESPLAWTQEAYRPPCNEYSFCCPKWVPPLSWPGQGGTLPGREYPTWVPPTVYPWQDTPPPPPPAGYPPQGTPPPGYPPSWTWQGTPPRCLPHGILGNVAKHYGIWVPPPRCGLTNKWNYYCTFPSYYVRGR